MLPRSLILLPATLSTSSDPIKAASQAKTSILLSSAVNSLSDFIVEAKPTELMALPSRCSALILDAALSSSAPLSTFPFIESSSSIGQPSSPSKDLIEFEFKQSLRRPLHFLISFTEVRPSRDKSRSVTSPTRIPGELRASISSVSSFLFAGSAS